ncbi:MAG: hypothetical protein AAGK82_10265, partial [Pseudomonadota bacterium]
MTHLWVRAEQRLNEERVGITPAGVRALVERGIAVTVEESSVRCLPIGPYAEAGAEITTENTWPKAPSDAIIFGLKELPEDDTPLIHRHIMFGHAYKGQPTGLRLLRRFRFQLISRMLRFPRNYFRSTSQGELVSMVTSEAEPMGGLMGDAVAQP